MAILSLIFATCALFACVYLYLELRKKLSRADVAPALKQSSEELSKNYAQSLRSIEAEWAEMYQKFMRIAGRVDKVTALENKREPIEEPNFLRRSDLLRRVRRG